MRKEKGKVKQSEIGETESNDEERVERIDEGRDEGETNDVRKEKGTNESVARKGGRRGGLQK